MSSHGRPGPRRAPLLHPGRLVATVIVISLAIGGGTVALLRRDPGNDPAPRFDAAERSFDTNDPVSRGCALEEKILLRVWRGFDPKRSEDVTMVPQFPNYSGLFDQVNHSGPWDYLTTVPLVLYGPERIAAAGRLETPATVADVYPTVAELAGVEVEERDGRVLSEALAPEAEGVPKLVLTIVWDGAGRNVLERWPESWPTLARLEREGTSYLDASVGSSPTITPSTHATLGTGAYPRNHGVTGIYYRAADGRVSEAFKNRDPSLLELTTYGDDVDAAYDNASKVGIVASRSWHMGMFSHGANLAGGDEDQLGIFRTQVVQHPGESEVAGITPGYSVPRALLDESWSRLNEYGREVDLSDGRADDEWYGHPVLGGELRDNPAWVMHETDAILQMLETEGYGADEVPDLFFTNLKMADTVGHHYLMTSREMKLVIEALDEGLRRIVTYLDREVGDYVVVLTADHGHTLPARETGAWPVMNGKLVQDIDAHFGTPDGRSLVDKNVAVGLFLNKDTMQDMGVTGDDIARYVNDYTVRDNWDGPDLPPGYEERGSENVFSAAWTKAQMNDVIECAFASTAPPADLAG